MATIRRAGTGYTNIGDILQLNRGAADAMNQRLGERVGQDAGAAAGAVTSSAEGFNPTTSTSGASSWREANAASLPGWQSKLEDAGQRVTALGSAEGRAALMDDYYGRGTSGGRRMDVTLSGMTRSPSIAQTQQKYAGVRGLLGLGDTIANARQQGFNSAETARQEEERKAREREQREQIDKGTKRNPIQTPGTMPDREPEGPSFGGFWRAINPFG